MVQSTATQSTVTPQDRATAGKCETQNCSLFILNKAFVYLIVTLNAFRVCQVGQLRAQFLIASGILL